MELGATALSLMIVAFFTLPQRKAFTPLVMAIALAALFNLPWLIPGLETGGESAIARLLSEPRVLYVGNLLIGALAAWGLIRLLGASSRAEKMARAAERRKDYLGAAELYLQEGSPRRAMDLFRRARAWDRAAKVAIELGLETEAAGLLRRAGGRSLAEAARYYRKLGDREAALRCDHDLAEWLVGEGQYVEAIEVWLRAGDPQRAIHATHIALSETRLNPSHPAFRAARRAAEDTRDHRTLARLYEVEGSWQAAGYSWREAGEHERAARNFRRAGRLDEAAAAEDAAGRPKAAAQLRLRQLKDLQDRLRLSSSKGDSQTPETKRLKVRIRQETETLIPHLNELGMESEMIEVLSSAGRIDEAVERLVAEGQAEAAAELARDAERWDLAGPILERLQRWGEASDTHELGGELERAAACAERAGEDARALQLYRSINMPERAAHCLARLGSLQDALVELHRHGRLDEACEVLKAYPGPVPDIPDVILDVAERARERGSPEQAIACLQRAVVGVALQPGRLDPAVALAKLLHEAGEKEAALAQLERVLRYDFSHERARFLRDEIERAPAPGPADTQPSAPAGRPVSPPAQQRYEILTELGRGGMGVVYKARDTRLEREVAIKVLRTTSEEEATRLEQEAKAAATLNHPGIVTIFDFEAGFDGYFITMEYVPGEALDMVIRIQPERIRDNLIEILTRLADAVAYAHDHQVIHRDLKPGNILLTPVQEVKILDFGIAARLDTGDSAGPAVCGTPYYMAPEQIRGEDTTAATDIYALGATCFHLATGEPPFKEGNVIDAHLTQAPPNPLDLAPELPPELATVVLRCLEKDPRRRFASATELRNALVRVKATS
jgi:tRNA A-37 threonylcarbamoyl transferase component Bud32